MSANVLIIVAAVCLIAEMFLFSYFLLFIGIGVLATGILTYFELLNELSFQLTAIAIFSIISIPILKPILKHFKSKETFVENSHLSPKKGDFARVASNGFIECHGTLWQADTKGFEINQRVIIKEKNGEVFLIESFK